MMSDLDHDPYRPPLAPLERPGGPSQTTEPVEGNPWLTVWTRPRGTIRRIVDADPTHGVVILGALWGFTGVLYQSYNMKFGDKLDPGGILAIATVIGATWGVVHLYLVGAFLRWAGSWLGGVASTREVRAALAWGLVPNASGLVVVALMILIGGPAIFQTGGLARLDPRAHQAISALEPIPPLLGLWGIVLQIRTVAEVHRFSSWTALAAWLLTILILASLFLVALALMLVAGLIPLPVV